MARAVGPRPLVALVWLLAAGQAAPAQGPATSSTQPSLAQQQESIRDRVQQLENRLLMLGRLLTESEPDQAQRLQAALTRAGERQVKGRLERLVQLLRAGQYADAEREQEALLADLQSMLTVLTDAATDLDRRRAERERLEGLRRAIRSLHDDQLQQLYRTRSIATASAPADSPALPDLERSQRALERRAADLSEQMRPAGQEAPKTPGERQMSRARQNMQDAGQRLAEADAGQAEVHEQAALEQLQRAADELDDALRQVRREELEETLAALETRFQSLLQREQQVRSGVGELQRTAANQRTHADELRLAELAKTQRGVASDAAAIVRILVGEGTTVILPDLAEQLASDAEEIADRLDRADTSSATQSLLDAVIAALEEIVAAIAQRRSQEQQEAMQPAEEATGEANAPLLPASAELRLLRSSQVRINQRTAELAEAPEQAADSARAEALKALGARQLRMAEMARRMNERK